MSEDNLQKIIISTIKEEKHLGKNLKKQCVDYIEELIALIVSPFTLFVDIVSLPIQLILLIKYLIKDKKN